MPLSYAAVQAKAVVLALRVVASGLMLPFSAVEMMTATLEITI
jgi:hypothetical protein